MSTGADGPDNGAQWGRGGEDKHGVLLGEGHTCRGLGKEHSRKGSGKLKGLAWMQGTEGCSWGRWRDHRVRGLASILGCQKG